MKIVNTVCCSKKLLLFFFSCKKRLIKYGKAALCVPSETVHIYYNVNYRHCIVVCVRECVSLSMVCPFVYIIADTPQIYLKYTTSKHFII